MSTFNGLREIETHKQQQQQAALKRWRELLNRLVKKDDLSSDVAVELDGLHTSLSITPALAQYAALVVERMEKKDAGKKFEAAQQAVNDAAAAITAHDREHTDLVSRCERDIAASKQVAVDLGNAKLKTEQRRDQADAARQELEALEKVLWQLLDHDDPETVAREQAEHEAKERRRRHITHAFNGLGDMYRNAKYSIVQLELHVADANAYAYDDLQTVEFVPLPDQDKAEMERLAAIARTAHSGKPWRYLTVIDKCAFADRIQSHARGVFIDFESLLKANGKFDPELYQWMTLPGQSQDELDKLVAKLARLHQRWMSGGTFDAEERRILSNTSALA